MEGKGKEKGFSNIEYNPCLQKTTGKLRDHQV